MCYCKKSDCMGLFGNKKSKIDLENIISVVLLEQTQLYGMKNNWELSFGDAFGTPMVMEQTVPTGSRLKFSVTYRNGKKEIVEVLSGTVEADVLLQKAIDPEMLDSSNNIQQKESVLYQSIRLQKNQLPTGDYLIGRQCFHVACSEDELLKVTGNLIVEISKSKEIKLDL